jgi:hypothetical protein
MCFLPQAKAYSIGPIDRASPYLRTTELTQGKIYKPNKSSVGVNTNISKFHLRKALHLPRLVIRVLCVFRELWSYWDKSSQYLSSNAN